MNPVSGNDILSYQGNAALGLNSDGLDQYGDTDAVALNKSVSDLAIQSMNKNKAIYDQKIKEREDTYKLIASGQLKIGAVRPEDRPKMMEYLQKVKDVLFKNHGDIQSNPDEFFKFQGAKDEFQEANLHATSRLLELDKLEADAAKEEDPDLQAAKYAHLKKQIDQDIFEPVKPFQQILDWKPENIFKPLPSITGAAKFDGDQQITETVTDIVGSRDMFLNDFNLNRDKPQARQMQLFAQQWLGNKTNPLQQPKPLEEVNNDLQRVNKKLIEIRESLPADDPRRELLTPIKVVQDENGVMNSTDTTPDLIWKINLATQYKKTEERKLNKDASIIALNREKIKTEKADQGLKGAQGKAALINARANMLKADSDRKKKLAEIRKINHGVDKEKEEGRWINHETMQMFDTDRYKSGENIISKISPQQQNFISKTIEGTEYGKKVVKKGDIASVVYNYDDINNPQMIVTLKPQKGKTEPETYTIRPTDIRNGIAKEYKFSANSLNQADKSLEEDAGTSDLNGVAIPEWNKRKVKTQQGAKWTEAYNAAIAQHLTPEQAKEVADTYAKKK